MELRTAGHRSRIKAVCLLVVSGVLPLTGCAFSRASETTVTEPMQRVERQAASSGARALHVGMSIPAAPPVRPRSRTNELLATDDPVSGPAQSQILLADEEPVVVPQQGAYSPTTNRQVGPLVRNTASSEPLVPALQPASAPMRLARTEPRPVVREPRAVVHASAANFEQHVLRSEVPVLVDFYATWCGPCRALAPTLDELAAETPQARVVKVDIDDNPELAARYGVRSVPCLMVFKNGQVRAKQSGVLGKTRLQAMLDL